MHHLLSEGLYGPFRALLCSPGLGLLECGKGDVEFRSRCLPLISPRMARFAVGASRLRVGAPFLRPPPPQYVVLLLGILHLPLSGRWLKQMAMSVSTFLSELRPLVQVLWILGVFGDVQLFGQTQVARSVSFGVRRCMCQNGPLYLS